MGPIIDFIVANDAIPTSIGFDYTVVEGIDDPLGKFANTLGNVAIVDCHSVGIKLKEVLISIL